METISVAELKKRLSDDDHDEVLIDVRDPFEYKGTHIEDAKNIPLDTVASAVGKLKGVGTIYIHCASGNSSKQACDILAEQGFQNVVNVEGGIIAWEEAGMKTVGGKKRMPIMRQTLLMAGLLILLGVVLALFVNTWWIFLPAFVGMGLTFAGVTGMCGMTKILQWMPWNTP